MKTILFQLSEEDGKSFESYLKDEFGEKIRGKKSFVLRAALAEYISVRRKINERIGDRGT